MEIYFTILNRLKSELEKRCAAYKNIFGKYNFLITLNKLSSREITKNAIEHQQFYNYDLEKSYSFECLHFKFYLKIL